MRSTISKYGDPFFVNSFTLIIGQIDLFRNLIQKQVYQNREVSATLVRRAEKYGFKAIVLTVDTPRLGRREKDIKNKCSFIFFFNYIYIYPPLDCFFLFFIQLFRKVNFVVIWHSFNQHVVCNFTITVYVWIGKIQSIHKQFCIQFN